MADWIECVQCGGTGYEVAPKKYATGNPNPGKRNGKSKKPLRGGTAFAPQKCKLCKESGRNPIDPDGK